MTIELERLLEVAGGFGTTPMLLTVDDDLRPRAAAVTVTWASEATDQPAAQSSAAPVAAVRAGRRSLANAGQRERVSLLWPAPPGERFALLVDARVTAVEPDADPRAGGVVHLRPSRGILHVVDRH